MLLHYFVTSRVRRALLDLLWAQGSRGSVSDLARKAHASFPATHRELELMRDSGLASSERVGAALVYGANPSHPHASLVRRLVTEGMTPEGAPKGGRAEKVRGWLAKAGAPLLLARRPSGHMPKLEEVLAEGLALAHHDAHVARVLPVLLWRQRERVDYELLAHAATRRNERQALGLFLELTGLLGGDRQLVMQAQGLRDKRRTGAQLFFARRYSPGALAQMHRTTPRVARRWGYLMDASLESFASAFNKHTEAA
jgi:hypothetical protein